MKTIIRTISILVLAAAAIACGSPETEFISASFISFSGAKYTVKENAPEIKIPVNLISDKILETTVTYQVTGGNAVVGEHYTMPNASGVLNVSNDPAKCDSIVICPIDHSGELTKNKTVELTLGEITADGIYMGGTSKCTVVIIDIDGGVNLLVGNWTGSDLASSGKAVSIEFSLDTCEPTEDYPEANVVIPAGMSLTDPVGNTWDSKVDIYAFFDDDKSELRIYPIQVFAGGNFGDDVGVLYVSMDLQSTMQGTEEPVILTVNDGVLTFKDNTYIALWAENGSFSGYSCGYITAGGEIRKND